MMLGVAAATAAFAVGALQRRLAGGGRPLARGTPVGVPCETGWPSVAASRTVLGGLAAQARRVSLPAANEQFPNLASNLKGDAVVAFGQGTDGGAGMTIEAAGVFRHCR